MRDDVLPLCGATVTLCRPAEADAEAIARLRSADSVRRWFIDDRRLNAEQNKQWLAAQATSATSGLLVIRATIDASFVGFVGWSDLDLATGTVQLGRIAIDLHAYRALMGARSRGPRPADEAGQLVLLFAFDVLKVNQVYVETLITNKAALSLCRRLGLNPTTTRQRLRPSGEALTLQVLELQRSAWAALRRDLLHTKEFGRG